MNFSHEVKNNKLILRLSGDLIGEESGSSVLEVVNSAIHQKAMTCVIDISNLRYINSSGIGVLITILTKFRNKGGEEWNINFVRNDKGANERSSYGRVTINFLLHNLAFTRPVSWPRPIKEVKKNISIMPSLTTTGTKETNARARGNMQPSLDAKIALSSSVNLDVTLNPDFSQTSWPEGRISTCQSAN